jgi:hypothetical protein
MTMTRYEGGFQLTGFDESTVEDLGDGAKLTKARIEQSFTGGFEGAGEWDGFMYYRADGTAVFTGIQRLTGAIDGRDGAVVLVSAGAFDGHTADSRWDVVEGSARGRLAGMAGTGESSAPHGSEGTYSLDVDFE